MRSGDRALNYLQEGKAISWRNIVGAALAVVVWLVGCYAIGLMFWAAYS